MHRRAALLMLLLCAGCSGFPEMTSSDGATLRGEGESLVYTKVDAAPTTCLFEDKPSRIWVCADGTASHLMTARLPLSFEGILLAEFDGRSFSRPQD